MARSERDVLVEYVLRDEENLSLALSIAEARDDIRTRVIADFVVAAVPAATERLGDRWAVLGASEKEIASKWAVFITAEYKDQPGNYKVQCAADGDGFPKWAYFAVRTERAIAAPRLKAHLDEVAVGKSTDVSVWYRGLDDRHLWWGDEATMIWLHRKGDAVEYVVSYLEKLARAVERGLAAPPEGSA